MEWGGWDILCFDRLRRNAGGKLGFIEMRGVQQKSYIAGKRGGGGGGRSLFHFPGNLLSLYVL